jgi:hypothetical protein
LSPFGDKQKSIGTHTKDFFKNNYYIRRVELLKSPYSDLNTFQQVVNIYSKILEIFYFHYCLVAKFG